MTIAKSSRRNIDPVFAKLNKDDKGRLQEGEESENLQYPSDLGTDEYNQFVLFTIFERNNAEVRNLTRKVRQEKEKMDAQTELTNQLMADGIQSRYSANPMASPGYVAYGASFLTGGLISPEVSQIMLNGAQNATIGSRGFADVSAFGGGVLNTFGENVGYIDRTGAGAAWEIANKKLEYARRKSAAGSRKAQESNFLDSTSERAFSQFENLGIKDRRGLGGKANAASSGRTRLAAATVQEKKSVALYIPNKIVNNGTISYNQGVNFSAVNQLMEVGQGNLSSVMPSLRRGLASMADSLGSIAGLNLNASEAIEAMTGLVINPRQEQLFQGVNSRSFDFTFSLAPRNAKEAVEVSKIVRVFREYSHPNLDSTSFFLEIPAEFEIRYYKIFNPGKTGEVVTENLFLNKIGRCALTAINVDYTPNGVNATFEDGSPVRTSVTMTFSELRPLVRQDIEEGF